MAWQTTSKPKRNFVTLRFDDDEYATLDAAAQMAGMDRSTYLRDCARRVAAADKKKAARLKTGAGEDET